MIQYQSLSNADSIIMEILWRDGETGSRAIVKELEATMHWTHQTVCTYLNRLADKGLVGMKQVDKRSKVYFPIVSREDYAAEKTARVLHEYYDNLPHMIAGILERERVTPAEIQELEKIIDTLKRQEGKLK